ncbi:putative signal transducing protein [Aquimarina sp. W85]|uniref:putative signal transducing protein n=1 Tax=Aquimarina rhodophyticola TaxID=3342246 RepID=UPI00366E6B3B
MFPKSNYERVYTGSLITIQFLQTILQDNGINSITRDDMKSGMMAGFGGGIPDHIQLFVKKEDLPIATSLIKQNI